MAVDPTDFTTPADTDFVKGAAAELRALKQYLQDRLADIDLQQQLSTLRCELNWAGSVQAPAVNGFSTNIVSPYTPITVTSARTGVGSYTVTLTHINYPVITSIYNAVSAILNSRLAPNKRAYVSGITQNTGSHTVTITIKVISYDGASSLDPGVNEGLDLVIVGNPNFPVPIEP